jgi:hypothetical protein
MMANNNSGKMREGEGEGKKDPRVLVVQSLISILKNNNKCGEGGCVDSTMSSSSNCDRVTRDDLIPPPNPLSPYGGVSPIIVRYANGNYVAPPPQPDLPCVIPSTISSDRNDAKVVDYYDHHGSSLLVIGRRGGIHSNDKSINVNIHHGASACDHVDHWKRLRAKRGYSYVVCYCCGVKWRIKDVPSAGTKNKCGMITPTMSSISTTPTPSGVDSPSGNSPPITSHPLSVCSSNPILSVDSSATTANEDNDDANDFQCEMKWENCLAALGEASSRLQHHTLLRDSEIWSNKMGLLW